MNINVDFFFKQLMLEIKYFNFKKLIWGGGNDVDVGK